MHRHARPGALLIIFVLTLLAGAVLQGGPASAGTGAAASTVDVTPQHDEVAHAATAASQQVTATSPGAGGTARPYSTRDT